MTSASEQATRTHAGTGTLVRTRADSGPPWLTAALGTVDLLVASFHFIVQGDFARAFEQPVVRLAMLAVVLTGAGLYATRHFSLVHDEAFRILASGFGIVVAFALSLVETSVPLPVDHPVAGVSAVAPWILFLGVVVPQPPGATLVAGLAAAATWPVAYAINADARGFAPVPWDHLIVWPGINVLTAVLTALLRRRLAGAPSSGEPAAALGSYRLI